MNDKTRQLLEVFDQADPTSDNYSTLVDGFTSGDVTISPKLLLPLIYMFPQYGYEVTKVSSDEMDERLKLRVRLVTGGAMSADLVEHALGDALYAAEVGAYEV